MKRSFYEILRVPHDADAATIDAAYAEMTQRVGEDLRRGVAEAAMDAQMVRDGYQILSDPAKRARYDAKLSASEKGVQLMFFPEDKGAQRALGVQSVVFALLATTFVGVVYWQMNRKISEVRADYDTVVARKQVEQNTPKVMDQEQAVVAAKDTEGTKADASRPRISDGLKGETLIKVIDPAKTDAGAKGAPETQAKR